ncbi:MAG: hypothetical protein WB562_13690, partial [Candidatus Sulfotelmatobacter sp.]
MNNHETLIRQIAEEMAKNDHTILSDSCISNDWYKQDLNFKKLMIDLNINNARIAVKHMAQQYASGYNLGTLYGKDYT